MKKDSAYLHHIYDAITNIENFIGSMGKDEFLKDLLVQSAIIRQLEIIGEATKNLSKTIKEKYEEVPWNRVAGMRDKLIHEYFGVKLELVWDTIQNKLPDFKNQVSKILKDVCETE